MTNEETRSAVWAAELHVKTTVGRAPGTMLGTTTTLAICRALIEASRALEREVERAHEEALDWHRAKIRNGLGFTGSRPLQVIEDKVDCAFCRQSVDRKQAEEASLGIGFRCVDRDACRVKQIEIGRVRP